MTTGESVAGAVESIRTNGTIHATSLAELLARVRGRHLLAIDLVAIGLSVYVALSLRLDGLLGFEEAWRYQPVAMLPLGIRPLVNARFGLYSRAWRHASVPDVTQILWATIAGTAACVAVFLFLLVPLGMSGGEGFPRSFWVMECVLSLASISSSRFMMRALSDLGNTVRVGGATVSLTPALLLGAGRSGATTARALLRDPRAGIRPVGILDGDESMRGTTVAGVSVLGGLDRLNEAIRRTGAQMLLITMPDAPGSTIRRAVDAALAAGLQVRTVPSLNELLDGSWDALHVRQVRVEDLLSREQVTIHADGVADTIRDQVIMVTGAGGSIGSELAKQVYGFHPRKLVLVDRAESPLYMIQRDLELRGSSGRGSGELSAHLANVASRAVITRLIEQTRPAVIFHAAACKHVPMMEQHPSEGVQVNIGGTMAVLGAAVAAGVPRFVLVSTDKAVEPTSVMGATKRVAEWLVADAAAKTGRPYVAVRFGNVLGSAGSVLPILQSQLENGEPLTVTHPDMTRYFMTVQEAGWLILDAAAIGRPGDLFVLDMGEPVRIIDLVHDLIRLACRDTASVPVRITGPRPGERLHEKLFYETERVVPTDVAKIFRVQDAMIPGDIRERADSLLKVAFGDRDDQLRALLFESVAVESRPGVSVRTDHRVAPPEASRTLPQPTAG
jgi:FlaA1/EpsC-like NDP-sugar epimerase